MFFLLAYIRYPSLSHYIRLSEHHPSPPPPPSKSLPQPSIVSNSKTSNHAWPLQPPLPFPPQNKTKTDFRPSQHAIKIFHLLFCKCCDFGFVSLHPSLHFLFLHFPVLYQGLHLFLGQFGLFLEL